MKKFSVLLFFLSTLMITGPAEARRGFGVALGPMANFYMVGTIPVMHPGIGAFTSFQYRFAEQIAFESAFMMTSQKGRQASSGDDGILLLGMPTFNLKFYFMQNDPKFDPFATIGIGLYILTEGSTQNNSGGAGLGSELGLGFDYFLSETFSLGLSTVFRSLAVIRDFATPSNSTAIFPFSLMGHVAFHF